MKHAIWHTVTLWYVIQIFSGSRLVRGFYSGRRRGVSPSASIRQREIASQTLLLRSASALFGSACRRRHWHFPLFVARTENLWICRSLIRASWKLQPTTLWLKYRFIPTTFAPISHCMRDSENKRAPQLDQRRPSSRIDWTVASKSLAYRCVSSSKDRYASIQPSALAQRCAHLTSPV